MAMAVAPAAMVKEEAGNWAKLCDSCRSAASAVYCRADSAYLCPGCDARVHAANWVASRHERVWVCEACECAPATLTCKADAASLCAACDAWIHSANPLAGRHCRLPISPISAVVAADRLRGASPLLGHRHLLGRGKAAEDDDDDGEDEVSSWLLLNPVYKSTGSQNSAGNSTGFLLGGEVDEYLDLVEYNSCGENQMDQDSHGSTNHEGSDSVVPHVEQCSEGHDQRLIQQQQQQQQQGYLIREMDQYEATKAGYKYNCAGSLTQSHDLLPPAAIEEPPASRYTSMEPQESWGAQPPLASSQATAGSGATIFTAASRLSLPQLSAEARVRAAPASTCR